MLLPLLNKCLLFADFAAAATAAAAAAAAIAAIADLDGVFGYLRGRKIVNYVDFGFQA